MSLGETAQEKFIRRIAQFSLLDKYLTPSLTEHFKVPHWYENRVIRYVLRNSPWICDLEKTLERAKLEAIPNSEEIFSVLCGTEADYDEQLFDALAEVRLAAWAWSQGYQGIKKLKAQQGRRTPEFLMRTDSKVALAEAKHFRVRDYLAYFIADRLEGLILKVGCPINYGLRIETGSKYNQNRDDLLSKRQLWIDKVRNELDEAWFSSLGQRFANQADQIEILGGLFVVKRDDTVAAGKVHLALINTLDPKETITLCLCKIKGDLTKKLDQIKGYNHAEGTNADKAIVFFSGVDNREPEWDELWSTLRSGGEQWAWDCVASVRLAADEVIKMPFELIVGTYREKGRGNEGETLYGTVEYGPFPWNPRSL